MEELVNGGIGLGFEFKGLDQFQKLTNEINKVKTDMKDVYQDMRNINTFTNEFSRNSQRGFNNIRKSVESLKARVRETGESIQHAHRDMQQFSHERISGLHEQFGNVKREIDHTKQSIHTAQQGLEKFNHTSVTRVANDFNKVKRSANSTDSDINKSRQSLDRFADSHLGGLINKFRSVRHAITDTKHDINGAKHDMNDMPKHPMRSFIANMKSAGHSTHETGEKARETGHRFHHLRDTILGVFAGGALENGFQNLGSWLMSATKEGLQLNATMDDINHRWRDLGMGKGQANAMVDQINQIRQHADISAKAITNMQRQYLTLTGSATQARALTSTITSFGKASGMTERQQAGITRLISSNKAVNARMFQRTFGNAPEFANEIIKQTGMSRHAFNQLLQSGKLTGKELRDAMIRASKDSGKAWNDYAKTATGRMDLIKATANTVRYSFERNLTGAMFKQLDKMGNHAGGLDKLQKRITRISADIGKAIGKILGGAIAFLVKNIGPIERMGSAIWQIVKALGSGVWSAVTAPLRMIAKHSKQGSHGMKGLANGLTAVSKHQTALRRIGKLMVGIFAFYKIAKTIMFLHKFVGVIKAMGLVSKVASGIRLMVKAIKAWNIVSKIATGLQWAWNVAMDANPIGLIVVAVGALVAGIYELYKHFKPFRRVVNGTFRAIRKLFSAWWHQVKRNFNAVERIIGRFARFFKRHFGNVIRDDVKVAKRAFNVIKDAVRVLKDVLTFNFKDLLKVIPKLVRDLWKLVKSIFRAGKDAVVDIGKDMWHAIWDNFKHWGKVITDFFKGLWKGIKQAVADGLNDVIGIINAGIKGLNWLLSKVGGSGHTINLIPKVHFARGSHDGRSISRHGKLTRNTMAVLNDGNDSPETNNKEMVVMPNGRAFIPQTRNWTGLLPKGSEVFNATETKMMMMLNGVRHFAFGSGMFGLIKKTAGHAWNAVKRGVGHGWTDAKEIAGATWNKAKDVGHATWNIAKKAGGALWNGVKSLGSILAHPIRWLSHFFGGLPQMPEYLTDLAGGMLNKAKDAVIKWFKKFGDMGNPPGTDVKRWIPVIKRAGEFMNEHLSGGDIDLILRRIQKESGGNPTIAQQVSDVNSASGHPAQGLLQYVPSTFTSWAVPGHTNLRNGYDQILAMFNDSNWRSDIANSDGWGPSGHRARRNGGRVNAGETYRVNESGFEMFKPDRNGKVINHEDSKRIVNNANKPVKIDARMNVTINGDADDKTLDKINKSHETQWKQIAQKLKQESNIDDGGMIFL